MCKREFCFEESISTINRYENEEFVPFVPSNMLLALSEPETQ